MYAHTEVSAMSLGRSSGATPPCSLPVFLPGPHLGDSEEERSILLYMGECTGVGGCRTCYQASATKAPCLLRTGLLPPRVRHCCPVSFHVLPMMGLEWQQVAVSILKMRTLKLRGQEGWRLTLPEPGWQGGKALGQGLD